MKGGGFLGPSRVLLQERETTAEGFRMNGVVWITEGTSLVRCAVDAPDDAWEEEITGTHEAHEIRAVAVLSGHNDLVQHHVWDLTWCYQVDL